MSLTLSIERKSRKFIRDNLGNVKKIKIIKILKTNDIWFNISVNILKKILYRGTLIKIVNKKEKNVITAIPLEHYCCLMLDNFLNNKKIDTSLYFLSNIPEKELLRYAKKNKINGKRRVLDFKSCKFLYEMSKKDADIFYSLRNGFEFLKRSYLKM